MCGTNLSFTIYVYSACDVIERNVIDDNHTCFSTALYLCRTTWQVLALASTSWWVIIVQLEFQQFFLPNCYCSSTTSTQSLYNNTSCMTSSIIYYYYWKQVDYVMRYTWSSSVASSHVSNIRRIKQHTQLLTVSWHPVHETVSMDRKP